MLCILTNILLEMISDQKDPCFADESTRDDIRLAEYVLEIISGVWYYKLTKNLAPFMFCPQLRFQLAAVTQA